MKNKKIKALLLLAMMALLLTAAVSSTIAWLADNSGPVENTFTPAHVSCSINEPGWSDGNKVKSNVSVNNTGDVYADIRAMIVVTWQNSNGDVYGTLPKLDTDYTLSLNTGTAANQWTESGAYYYYNSPVAPNTATGVLINSCEVKADAPEAGYNLHVEVLAQAIQAEGVTGATGITDTWSSAKTNGKAPTSGN